MFLIKTHNGDGAWDLHRAEDELRYLGNHCVTEVPYDPEIGEHNVHQAPGVPLAQIDHIYLTPDDTVNPRLVRWAAWRDSVGTSHLLVTDREIYVMNDRGETVESLR